MKLMNYWDFQTIFCVLLGIHGVLASFSPAFPEFDVLDREKRFLVFPPTSPTRHQFIAGIGVPITSDTESVTFGWVVKAQYFLPELSDHLKPTYAVDFFQNYTSFPLRWKPFPYAKRRRSISAQDHVEHYDVEVQEIGNQDLLEEDEIFEDQFDDEDDDEFLENYRSNFNGNFEENSQDEYESLQNRDYARWAVYDGFARILNNNGFDGRVCVMRAICESAETEFSDDGGLFGELMHLVFTPSTTSETIANPEHFDYLQAEHYGKSGLPCQEIYKKCKLSPLEIFTKIF